MAEKRQSISHIDGFISIDITIEECPKCVKIIQKCQKLSNDNSAHIFYTVLGFNKEAPLHKTISHPFICDNNNNSNTSEYNAEEKLKVLYTKGDTHKASVVRYNHIKLILLFDICYAVQSCY